MDKNAKKIADIFADGRLDKSDINTMALSVVLESRHDEVLDRIQFFVDMFTFHRNTIEIGRDRDLTPYTPSDRMRA
jgi:hypothetical protein